MQVQIKTIDLLTDLTGTKEQVPKMRATKMQARIPEAVPAKIISLLLFNKVDTTHFLNLGFMVLLSN